MAARSDRARSAARIPGISRILLLVLFCSAGSCAHRASLPVARPREQAFDVVYTSHFDSVRWVRGSVDTLDPRSHRRGRPPRKPPRRMLPAASDSARIHPAIRAWLGDSLSAPARAQLILTFRDSVVVPRMPGPLADTLFGTAAWTARQLLVDSLVAATRGLRAARYAADSIALAARGVETHATSWLTRTMLVTAPISRPILRALVDTLGVLYVQPRFGGERPPGRNGSTIDDPAVARCNLHSDPYVPFCPQYGRIALLDTGVRTDHENLAGVVLATYACADQTSACLVASVPDPCSGHGTSTAALLAGNDAGSTGSRDCEDPAQGRFEGVTDAGLDVYGVYGSDCSTGAALLDTWAAKLAVDDAARNCAIIVAEIDGHVTGPGAAHDYTADDCNTMSNSADAAYLAGALVVAAVGDQGTGTVAAPGVARRAIAVGGYSILTGNPYDGGCGPTGDDRTKPDIIAPTNAETADNGASDQYNVFGGTSGATAVAGGGATLLRNWLVWAAGGTEGNVDPGQVCAQIILSGQSPAEPIGGATRDEFERETGAGRMVLPTNGYCRFGKTSFATTGDEVWAEFTVLDGVGRLEAALWWPETPLTSYTASSTADTHNDIDLEIYDPDGNRAAHSLVQDGVFERATASPPSGATNLMSGTWKIRVVATEIKSGPQTVYWTAGARYP